MLIRLIRGGLGLNNSYMKLTYCHQILTAISSATSRQTEPTLLKLNRHRSARGKKLGRGLQLRKRKTRSIHSMYIRTKTRTSLKLRTRARILHRRTAQIAHLPKIENPALLHRKEDLQHLPLLPSHEPDHKTSRSSRKPHRRKTAVVHRGSRVSVRNSHRTNMLAVVARMLQLPRRAQPRVQHSRRAIHLR